MLPITKIEGYSVENIKKTYDLISNGFYTHATPTLFNSGNKRSQLSSCFLLGTDDSIEGIKLNDRPAFSVQYHPEATPGPHDSRYLFDDFVSLMKTN